MAATPFSIVHELLGDVFHALLTDGDPVARAAVFRLACRSGEARDLDGVLGVAADTMAVCREHGGAAADRAAGELALWIAVVCGVDLIAATSRLAA